MIFLILKIIGIILLILLLIILAVLAVILFVPIKYELTASKYDKVLAVAKASWLFKLLRVYVDYDQAREGEALHIRAKAAFLTLYQSPPVKKAPDSREKQETSKEAAASPAPEGAAKKPPAEETAAKAEETAAKTEEKEPQAAQQESQKAPPKAAEAEPQTQVTVSHPPEEKKKEAKEGSKKKACMPDPDKESLSDKLEKLRDKKEKIMALIEDEQNQVWLHKTLFRLRQLLIYLMPDIRKLYLHFGFKDPSLTGRLLGGLSTMYGLFRDRMTLEPEFEKEILEGEVMIGGSIRVIRLLIYVLPCILNPKFFRLIKQIRQLK